MSNGASVSNTPLPIENPTPLQLGSPKVIFVEPCPISDFYFLCKNILVDHHVDAHITAFTWGYFWRLMLPIVPSLLVRS
jgi:hypothetical protein